MLFGQCSRSQLETYERLSSSQTNPQLLQCSNKLAALAQKAPNSGYCRMERVQVSANLVPATRFLEDQFQVPYNFTEHNTCLNLRPGSKGQPHECKSTPQTNVLPLHPAPAAVSKWFQGVALHRAHYEALIPR